MREKKEQTLTLTLPEKKDSGSLQEDSFDCPEFSAETFNAATEQALKTAGESTRPPGSVHHAESAAGIALERHGLERLG
jgi:hypothetical protein